MFANRGNTHAQARTHTLGSRTDSGWVVFFLTQIVVPLQCRLPSITQGNRMARVGSTSGALQGAEYLVPVAATVPVSLAYFRPRPTGNLGVKPNQALTSHAPASGKKKRIVTFSRVHEQNKKNDSYPISSFRPRQGGTGGGTTIK